MNLIAVVIGNNGALNYSRGEIYNAAESSTFIERGFHNSFGNIDPVHKI